MKRFLITAIALAFVLSAKAQSADTIQKPADTSSVFVSVELAPSFPGGVEGFYQYLGKSIHYPQEARSNGEEGRVMVQMIVEKDGSLSHIVVLRSVSYSLDKEAVRVLTASPKWTPGIQNGHPVRVQYAVPINFNLK
jgi:protein TonB